MGLGLYAIGAFMFYPAKLTGSYYPFLIAYFILTCGLSFLETSANPFILSMGDRNTATRRLNLAQSFNPIGSLMGMFVAMQFIQSKLSPLDTQQRAILDNSSFETLKKSDLAVLIAPYLIIGIVILVMFLLIYFMKIPKESISEMKTENRLGDVIKRLFNNTKYREGVIAQFFYVGVQIMCWTFIIQYGTRIFMLEGMGEKSAEIISQKYNMIAMILFCCSRFICTFLLKYIRAGKLLMFLAIFGVLLTIGVIACNDRLGLYCLVAISGCMSLMFPTIYGLALDGVEGDDTKLGAAGLIMAILGGSILPPLQAKIIDGGGMFGISSINISFILPLFSFIVIVIYGFRALKFTGK